MVDIPYCLPDYIPVPVYSAMHFHAIGDNLSHRDLAYAVSALWLAANTDCRQGDSPTRYRIPDNGLRHAMGLTRREPIDIDDARHVRLRRTSIESATASFPAPFSESRHNKDDKRAWILNERLVADWKVEQGQPVVWLPLLLLQKGNSRFSIEAYLHAMAAALGYVTDQCTLTRRLDDRLTVQANETGFRRFVGAGPKHDLYRCLNFIVPELDKDLPPWGDVAIEPKVRTSSSPRFPKGRFMSALIHVMHPPVAEIEAKAASMATWMAPVREAVPGWEKKLPRPRHLRAPARRPLPAPIADVAVIMPKPELPVVRVPRKGEPGYVHYDDDADIAF